jgi:hypothetical protein
MASAETPEITPECSAGIPVEVQLFAIWWGFARRATVIETPNLDLMGWQS